MHFRLFRLGPILVLALILGACSPTLVPSMGDSPLVTPAEGRPTALTPDATLEVGDVTAEPPEPTGTAPALPDGAEALLELARQDLAARLGVPDDQIAVTSITAVDWPDTSLGCPEPGGVYAEVITPGFEILLDAGGQQYAYHTDAETVLLCENAAPELTPTAGVTPTLAVDIPVDALPLVEQAVQDLATRLGVTPDQVTIESVEAVEWRDSSLGCPQPGMKYLMVITPGYLIKLQAGGQTHEYHTSADYVVTCADPQPPVQP